MENNSPLSLKYIKTMSSHLRLLGAWPSDVFGEKLPWAIRFHRIALPFQMSLIAFGGSYYLYDNFHRIGFLDMGHIIITTLLGMVTVLRSVLPNLQKFKSLIRNFINDFHLMHIAHKGEYYDKINETVDKISTYYTIFSTVMMLLAVLMFNIGPNFNNLRNTVFSRTENYSMQYSVYFSYPGFNPLDYNTCIAIYNCYLSYITSTMFCGIDLLIFLMIFQTIGHVNILRQNLENFRLPKNKVILTFLGDKSINNKENCFCEKFDAEENKTIRTKLAECIEHHRLIIGFTDDLSQIFGPVLAFNYFFHMVSCCLLLLECTEGGLEAVIRYGPLTFVVFGQLIQMSVMFELLGSETEKLKDSLYSTPWENMNVSNQRTVCLMLHKMQDRISVKALGLAAVGLSTMLGILKTTFSYFAFLKTMEVK